MFPPPVIRSKVIYIEPNVAAPLTEWRPMELESGTTLDSERSCENFRSANDYFDGRNWEKAFQREKARAAK